MLKLEYISKSYGNVKALSDINLTLKKGEVVGLLGVNGAGKSTLLKILSTIITPDKGEIMYGDQIYRNSNIRARIGYLSEDNPLYEEMYVREYLDYVAGIYRIDKDEIVSLISQMGLDTEVGKKIKTLSRGNRQRVGIAQALLPNPEILILDEATAGLDPNQREKLIKLLSDLSEDKIILFSTHVLQEVKSLCSRIILIHEGCIVADEAINNIESTEETFHQLTNENNS